MNTILGLKKLKEIFEEKNWKEENYFFNKCCDVFIRLNSEEQVFFLKLVKNFKWVRYTDYLKELKEILSEIYLKENKILKKKNEIYILPLLNLKEIIFESEDRKTKSSNFLCYLFCSHELFNHCIFDNKKVRVLEKAFFLQKNKDNNVEIINNNLIKKISDKKSLIILVDDFIGSGETAKGALEFLKENKIEKENILVLSIVINRQGYNFLKEKVDRIYFRFIADKMIDETKEMSIVINQKEMLESISKKMKIKEKEKIYGFKNCENLVSMLRTPNNTIGLFHDHKYGIMPRS